MTKRKFAYSYRHFDEQAEYMAKIYDVLMRWHAGRGEDTKFISLAVRLPEAEVCKIIAAEQDRRHFANTAA